MLNNDVVLVVIEGNGFNERRSFIHGVKCGRFGQFAYNANELPKSEILDDFIYK